MTIMRILGVDPSLSSFGFARVEFDGGPSDIFDWRFSVNTTAASVDRSLSKGDDLSARLRSHFRALEALLDSEVHRPGGLDAVAVEAVAFLPGKIRWSTISALGRARQVVDDAAAMFRLRVVEVPASTVGRVAMDGAPGRATKADRRTALLSRFPGLGASLAQDVARVTMQEHALDAFAAALAARSRL